MTSVDTRLNQQITIHQEIFSLPIITHLASIQIQRFPEIVELFTKEKFEIMTGSAGEQLDDRTLYERQKQWLTCEDYDPAPTIVADGLQIPENIGSVLRLADASGSKNVIFINDSDDQCLNRVRRTARNCDALIPWEFTTPESFLKQHLSCLPTLIAIELTNRSTNVFETSLPTECTFAIGNERHGVTPKILEHCQQAVQIPMYGVNGSMNVTHALAIVLFEWRRQHSASPAPSHHQNQSTIMLVNP